MNDHELDLALAAMGQQRTAVADLPELHELVRSTTATAPQHRGFLPPFTWRLQSMFGAAKFVAAAAIVALFGGFLLAGVLTTQEGDEMAPAAVTESPSPMTTEAFLSTMVTDEVEPGVFRVMDDGYRDLTQRSDSDYLYPGWRTVFAGDVGTVWRTAECVAPDPESGCLRLYRVGQEPEWDIHDPFPVTFWTGYIDAGLDGRLWATGQPVGEPRVFDDGTWVPDAHHLERGFSALAVQDDGTVWLLDHDLCWTGESSAGCTSWADVYDGDVSHFVVTADGVVWFMTESDPISFLRFDGSDWQVVPAPAGYPGDMSTAGTVGAAPDGSTWWTAGDPFIQHQSLTRLDEEGWTTFSSVDGVGAWGGQRGEWGAPTAMLKVAPDGSAWVNATRAMGTGTTRTTGLGIRTCDGVARFDGDAWRPFLAGACISDLDFTPDGSAWVVALDRRTREISTYVITSEAVAASE